MTWTKLSDNWTDRADLAELSFEDRWHYLAIIQLCSRSGRFDGLMRMVDARRCSDHPDPAAAITRLIGAGRLERVGADIRLVDVEEHVPSPSVRNRTEQDKYRKRRSRAHKAGDHSMCLPEHCADAPVTETVTQPVTRDPGTGRDGPGLRDHDTSTDSETSALDADPVWVETGPGEFSEVAAAPRSRKSKVSDAALAAWGSVAS